MVTIWDRHPSVTRVFKFSLYLPHLTAFLCIAQVSKKGLLLQLQGMLVCI